VLHIPDLHNNLLSVLYLTQNCGFYVDISFSHMTFCRPKGSPLFYTSINSNNTAFLDGTTSPMTEFASPASTYPMDI
ncbi:uncharacterized protein HD556DRAFT_1210582, partial [Suillus plorans]